MKAPAPKTRRSRSAVLGLAALIACAGLSTVSATSPANPAGPMSYLVLAGPDDIGAVTEAITTNGGSVHVSHERIGVIVARSSGGDFADRMRSTHGVTHVGATRTKPIASVGQTPETDRLMLERPEAVHGPGTLPRVLAEETPEWDMKAINADQAWAVNPGRPDVVTAVIDTGVDDTHEDLAANFDAGRSASCVGGRVDQTPGAWRPDSGASSYHGTHVAGTIAAARNGRGVVGVAPGSKISAIKVSEGENSWFYAENVVCAFMFAAEKKIPVTNNSYFVDPWQFNCPDDPDQAAIAEGVRRAMIYAETNGALNIIAAGNASTDLTEEARLDAQSPNDGTPVKREITKRCLLLPQELPGAFNVSATTGSSTLAGFSNHGLGKIDVAAPGEGINSTLPGNRYGVLSGTSMAAPHAAGVAALLVSTHPGATVSRLRGLLRTQATDWACADHGNDPKCTGPASKNSFFGEGMIDALKAVQP